MADLVFNPPPGWPLPAFLVDLPQLRPLFNQIPATVTYLNLGPVRNKGVELSLDHSFTNEVSASLNYSWQDEPEVLDEKAGHIRYPSDEISLPPTHRINAGVNYHSDRFIGQASINYADGAFWSDVLTAPFFGFTDSYTLVNGSFGVKWRDGKVETILELGQGAADMGYDPATKTMYVPQMMKGTLHAVTVQ